MDQNSKSMPDKERRERSDRRIETDPNYAGPERRTSDRRTDR